MGISVGAEAAAVEAGVAGAGDDQLKAGDFGDGIEGIRRQLKRYGLPDKKIPQDIVATLSMVAWLLYPLYITAYPEGGEDEEEDSSVTQGTGRYARLGYQRGRYNSVA